MITPSFHRWAFFLIVASAVTGVRAEEPASAFLEALRARQYYDMALLYLDQAVDDPLISDEFRERVAYERGITLIEAAAAERDMFSIEAKLTAARLNLNKFLGAHPQHPQAAIARRQLGSLLSKWAQIKVEKADDQDEPNLRQEAAELYEQAFEIFDNARSEARKALAEFPDKLDRDTQQAEIERRETLRSEYLSAWLSAAETQEKKAHTAADDSPKHRELLEQAAERYGELYEQHPSRLAGLLARMYQGRVMIKLGNLEQALTFFKEDLLTQDDHPQAFRDLKLETLLLAMDCWLHASQSAYAEAISRGNERLETMRPGEATEPNWLQLQLQVAQAHQQFAEQLAAQDPRDRQIRNSRDAAKQLAIAVARVPSEYQLAARELLAELPGGLRVTPAQSDREIETFDAALNAGRDAIAATQNAQFILENVPERLQRETDEQVKQELLGTIQEAEETIVRSRQEAMDAFQLALQLVDSETPLDDLNQVRYSLAYLYFVSDQYYEAAVLGEFVGRRTPGSSWARKAAQLALTAFWKLYERAADEDRFEVDRIVSIANYIVDTWPNEPEAVEAMNTLIPFLIKQGKLQQAQAYVENIAEDSPERGAAELQIGRAMWRNYLAGNQEVDQWESSLEEDAADADSIRQKITRRKSELEQTKAMAISILESGVKRMQTAARVDVSIVLSVLTLANIYVDTDQAARAVELLDNPHIGALPLLANDDPVMQQPLLAEEAYRVALSALVAALPRAPDSAARGALIERIRQTMENLKSLVDNDPTSQKRLVGILLKLAEGLKRQISLLDNVEDRRLLAKGFESFLDQVRADSTDFKVLNWVAQSYSSLGSALEGDKAVAALSKNFFNKSVETYDQILNQTQADKVDAAVIRQLKLNQAIALREAGQFERAIQRFTDILQQESRVLNIQVEAARTYQQWAAVPGQAGRYLNANRGGQKDDAGNNLIWGWGRLAQVTQRHKQYRSTFHEARYNLALCKYKLALRQKDTEQRTLNLKQAKRDIDLTRRLFPDLGGKSWRPKYDSLLQQIDRART